MSVGRWIKQEKLRELPLSDLRDRVAELKAALFTSRFQRSTGKLDNYRTLPLLRRRLAAALTLIRERELAEQAQEADK
jgi:ribosomal protein L29